MDVFEALGSVDSLGKKDAGGEEWCNEGANTLHGLGEREADLRIAGKATDGEETFGRASATGLWAVVANSGDLLICGHLESREASADNEHAAAEAAEGPLDSTRPEQKTSNRGEGQILRWSAHDFK